VNSPASEVTALNITILLPEKLSYSILALMVRTFRKQTGHFPDLIEFTPDLLDRFPDVVGGEGAYDDEFLGIRCTVDPKYLESHNMVTA